MSIGVTYATPAASNKERNDDDVSRVRGSGMRASTETDEAAEVSEGTMLRLADKAVPSPLRTLSMMFVESLVAAKNGTDAVTAAC